METKKLKKVLEELLANNNDDPNIDPKVCEGYGLALNDVADHFGIELECQDGPEDDGE
jgi:hypothetical protein